MEKYKDINVKKILKDQTYSVIAELAAAVWSFRIFLRSEEKTSGIESQMSVP